MAENIIFARKETMRISFGAMKFAIGIVHCHRIHRNEQLCRETCAIHTYTTEYTVRKLSCCWSSWMANSHTHGCASHTDKRY